VGQVYEAEKLAARKLVDGGLNELRCSSANREDLMFEPSLKLYSTNQGGDN
jgi:hypothetical protein